MSSLSSMPLSLARAVQIVAHASLEIHGHIESGILAEELAALGAGEIVLALHRFTRAQ
jgi:hypothetical protein